MTDDYAAFKAFIARYPVGSPIRYRLLGSHQRGMLAAVICYNLEADIAGNYYMTLGVSTFTFNKFIDNYEIWDPHRGDWGCFVYSAEPHAEQPGEIRLSSPEGCRF